MGVSSNVLATWYCYNQSVSSLLTPKNSVFRSLINPYPDPLTYYLELSDSRVAHLINCFSEFSDPALLPSWWYHGNTRSSWTERWKRPVPSFDTKTENAKGKKQRQMYVFLRNRKLVIYSLLTFWIHWALTPAHKNLDFKIIRIMLRLPCQDNP